MEQHIPYEHRAPYCTLNRLTNNTKRVWLVFHGYGQLSRFFIRKFEALDPNLNFIIAPQGLSRYYLEGFSGRVGASWMTSEDRLTDIENQKSYLDQVVSRECGNISNADLVYFGFSQGVATMCRHAAHARRPFSQMILWAGTFPPELEASDFDFLSGGESVSYFTGNQDPFYEEGMEEEQLRRVSMAMGLKAEVVRFDGGHEVKQSLINQL